MRYRRQFLRGLAVAGAVAIAGCSGDTQPDERPDPPRTQPPPESEGVDDAPTSVAAEWGLDGVVNLRDAGADDTGAEPIDDALAEHATDGTLVYLPAGRYRLDERFSLGADTRFGVLGASATIVPPDGSAETMFGFGYPEPMDEVYVRGLTFDYTAPDTGGRPILARAENRVVLQDVSVSGEIDVEEDQVRLDVTDPAGVGLVERLSLPDGSIPDSGVTGCEVGDDNHGDVSFVDCHIEGFADNGLYADPPEGSVTVDGGYFRNNGIAGIRVETNESSVVRGAHVVCDDGDSDFENMRGIRLRAGNSLLVEDCVVELLAVSGSDGAVTFASELESATVRNCRLHVDADNVNAVRLKSPNSDATRDTERGPFRCEGVTITGSAAGGAAIQAANRNGCEFRNVCVHQSGADRDGINADNVHGSLSDVRVAVTGDPLALQNSSLSRQNVTLTPYSDEQDCQPLEE